MKLHNNKKDLWVEDQKDQPLFFDNLPELMRPEKAAFVLGVSKQTIYDWRYRQKQKSIPPEMFIKINRMLYLRTNVLKQWIALQNG
ncbi:MAG: hypothetical protein COV44_02970 [Deltaproteobacteria bacterium CG11_big_fil_rev_8_21_14_0_20_45_16]|nr:MAG: hypothetical protein COV44_02970 [Deltaproteobacteria bacterium CG11_big_fil_rev_8_21_14_0_20_45_16]